MSAKPIHYFVSYQVVGKTDSSLNGVGNREVYLAKPIRGMEDVNLVSGYLELRIASEAGLRTGSITVAILNWQRFENGGNESNWLVGESVLTANGHPADAVSGESTFDFFQHKNPPPGWVPCPNCKGAAVTGRDGSACLCAVYGQYPGWQAPRMAANDEKR